MTRMESEALGEAKKAHYGLKSFGQRPAACSLLLY